VRFEVRLFALSVSLVAPLNLVVVQLTNENGAADFGGSRESI